MNETCAMLRLDKDGHAYCMARGTAYCCLPFKSKFWTEMDDCPRYEMKED
jgi:hypothetical protein